MATIKSYSDLHQSKKLAEILPLESADMHYFNYGNIAKPYIGFDVNETKPEINKEVYEYIPCWSLSALLDALPKRLEIVDNVYELSIYLYGLYYWNVNNGNLFFESKDKDNLVDACYEMVIKLRELNLL